MKIKQFVVGLSLLLIGLKLGGVIAWPWYLVLLPVEIGAGLAVLMLGVVCILAGKK